MHEKTMPDPAALDGNKLWDELLKAIVSAMPTQLFPLFKEVYGRDYPKDTPIVVLGSETSSFGEDSKKPPGSTLMDITHSKTMDKETGEITLCHLTSASEDTGRLQASSDGKGIDIYFKREYNDKN